MTLENKLHIKKIFRIKVNQIQSIINTTTTATYLNN
jgi:hypothetical protein